MCSNCSSLLNKIYHIQYVCTNRNISGTHQEVKVSAYLNMAADMTHNFTDGLAIGTVTSRFTMPRFYSPKLLGGNFNTPKEI